MMLFDFSLIGPGLEAICRELDERRVRQAIRAANEAVQKMYVPGVQPRDYCIVFHGIGCSREGCG